MYIKEYMKSYYAEHRDEINARKRELYDERKKEYHRVYYQAHKEERREMARLYCRRYYAAHKEEIKERRRQRRKQSVEDS